jgi:hypothetical protein
VPRQVLPDPREGGQRGLVFHLGDVRHRRGQAADRLRSAAVGEGAVVLLPLRLEQIGDLVEDLRDPFVRGPGERERNPNRNPRNFCLHYTTILL